MIISWTRVKWGLCDIIKHHKNALYVACNDMIRGAMKQIKHNDKQAKNNAIILRVLNDAYGFNQHQMKKEELMRDERVQNIVNSHPPPIWTYGKEQWSVLPYLGQIYINTNTFWPRQANITLEKLPSLLLVKEKLWMLNTVPNRMLHKCVWLYRV